jgi:DNA-binding NtrC family response regulator
LQAGFSEYLIKPIKLDNLEAAIERALGSPDTCVGKAQAPTASAPSFINAAL